jgi:Tol biopolymer transport system component
MWGPPEDYHLRLVRPSGTDEHEMLPDLDGLETHPDWSPGGQGIAFGHTTPAGTEQLWVVNADGSDARSVAEADPGCGLRYPDWAETDTVFFALECAGPAPGVEITVARSAIRQVDLNSGQIRTLLEAEFPRTVEQARLSPDGTRIALVRFRLDRNTPDSAVFVVDLESGAERRVTDWPLMAFHPDWIDHDTLVFNRHWDLAAEATDIPHDLYRVDADGSDLTRLTSYDVTGPRAAHPRVAADGSGITFTHVDGPTWDDRVLAFIRPNGEGFRWLTEGMTPGTHPQCRPLLR